jgi:hypothetical protein
MYVHRALVLTRNCAGTELPGLRLGMSDDDRGSSPAARGGFGARAHRSEGHRDDRDSSRAWRTADFPVQALFVNCTVKCHEDVPRHIWRLFQVLGIQHRWILTRGELGRESVSTADLTAINDAKEAAWMALHAHERDLLEDTMYSRLAALWSEFSDAITIFDKPEKVLKKAGLAGADWDNPDSVHALYAASTKFWPRTLRSDSDADSNAYAVCADSDSDDSV